MEWHSHHSKFFSLFYLKMPRLKWSLNRLSLYQNCCIIPLHSTCNYCMYFPLPFALRMLNCLPIVNMSCFLSAFSASLSPDIAESLEPVPVGVSQLEGSPMDTSSPASGTQEEPVASSAPPNHMSQELSGSGDSGLTDRQTDVETGWVFGPQYFIDK